MQATSSVMNAGPHVFVLLMSLIVWGGMIVGWIFFLVAVWRAMKAHESVAESLRKIAERDP
jgi:hypothetical protein